MFHTGQRVILGLSRIDDLSNWQSESLLQDSPPKLEDAPPKLELPPKPELDTDPPKPDELWPRDPNENPPPPPRPPAPSKGLRLVSGEQPSARGSPVCPGGQEQSTCPSPLFWGCTIVLDDGSLVTAYNYLTQSSWATWTWWTGGVGPKLWME